MIGQFQILSENYVSSSHCQSPYMLENPVVFSQLPTFNDNPSGLVRYPDPDGYLGRSGNTLERCNNKRRANTFENPRDSLKTSRFTRNFCQFHNSKRRFINTKSFSSPFAPHNTTTFIIHAKKFGGIASLVSPCAVTPTILTTSTLSSSTVVILETAKEKWGVDEYDTMKGLIRLRKENENFDQAGENNDCCEVFEVEKRLNNDLSRFEMIYPTSCGDEHNLENRVDEHGLQIKHLEEQNLTFKEIIFLMERELGDLRRRVVCLETEGIGAGDHESENFNDQDVCLEKSIENGDHIDNKSEDN